MGTQWGYWTWFILFRLAAGMYFGCSWYLIRRIILSDVGLYPPWYFMFSREYGGWTWSIVWRIVFFNQQLVGPFDGNISGISWVLLAEFLGQLGILMSYNFPISRWSWFQFLSLCSIQTYQMNIDVQSDIRNIRNIRHIRHIRYQCHSGTMEILMTKSDCERPKPVASMWPSPPLAVILDISMMVCPWFAHANHRKTMGKPWENHGKMMEKGWLPSGND